MTFLAHSFLIVTGIKFIISLMGEVVEGISTVID
jgi:hypothetical protein